MKSILCMVVTVFYCGMHARFDITADISTDTIQKMFRVAVKNKDEQEALALTHEVIMTFYRSRPKIVDWIIKKYKKAYGHEPRVAVLRSKQLAQDNDVLKKERDKLTSEKADHALELRLKEVERANALLRSQMRDFQLKRLEPELKAAKAEAARVRMLETRESQLRAKLEMAQEQSHKAQKCNQALHEAQLELSRANVGSHKAAELERQVKQLQQEVHDARGHEKEAQMCDIELKKAQQELKDVQAEAKKKFKALDMHVKALEGKLNKAQQEAQQAYVCEQELRTARGALQDAIDQLYGLLNEQ